VAVLVVVVLLSLAAYQYGEMMTAEAKASNNAMRAAQARGFARSGIFYAAALLCDPNNMTTVLNSNPYNNPQVFNHQVLQANEQARLQGCFSLVAPLAPDDPNVTGSQPYTYGVLDESSKINLTALMQLDPSGQTLYNMLLLLPNMTEEIANAILDWLDPDDTPREGGAESDYYSGLNPAYSTRNGPLDSIEELLAVQGVTWQLLFGNDRNRNGTLDLPDEDDGTGQHDRGWSAYLTVYSREQNVDSQGNARINVNSQDLSTLYNQLTSVVGQDLATYIVLYRQYGASTGTGSGAGGAGNTSNAGGAGNMQNAGGAGKTTGSSMNAKGSMAASAPAAASASSSGGSTMGKLSGVTSSSMNMSTTKGGNNISSLYSLINSQVSVPSADGKSPATVYPSPLSDQGSIQQLLPLLLDSCTTSSKTEIPARINVNTAPSAVLYTLPNLQEQDVQNILAMRPQSSSIDPPDPIFQTTAWLITEANISPSTMSKLEQYITTRSQVYRVQSIGYFDGGGPSARVEAVIDTNGGVPRILYYRDLTELGKGFDLQNNQ
jgi:type II secretory pathway component PulK